MAADLRHERNISVQVKLELRRNDKLESCEQRGWAEKCPHVSNGKVATKPI
jgi:hypothetical protein